MLASLLWPVTAFICRGATFSEDKMVTVVALREWLVKYGWIPDLCDMVLSMFSSVLWPNTFLSNQTLSSSGLNLVDSALSRWNKNSTSGLRCERYDLMV